MRRLLRRADAGHTAVIESVLVGIVVITAVAFVATHAEPPSAKSQARASLLAGSTDALFVLSELPASGDSPHESLLEEYITEGLRGDCTNLTKKLDGYYAPGVVWNVYLEKGRGVEKLVCSNGNGTGERTTTFTTIQPNWNKLFVVPNVTQISGVAELDLLGNPVDIDPLALHGVLVRNCFVDETTEVSLTLTNGYDVTFGSYNGVRYTGQMTPEYVSAVGHVDGYAVPYNTNGTWSEYEATTLDVTQDPSSFGFTHSLGALSGLEAVEYEVHPGYTLSGTISTAIDTLDSEDKFQPENKKAHLGGSMKFSYNYGTIASTLSTLKLSDATIDVYNPVGVVQESFRPNAWAGNRTFNVTQDMLWGTYVAHLQLQLEEVDAFGVPTGNVYIVNQLTHFTVIPPEWVDMPQYIPPVYRVTLSAGYPDWA